MIDLSLLFNNSAAAKNGEAATNLFANASGKEAKDGKESFAQHMNRLKPPADEIHALLAQAKHGNAEFPAAETVAESMVGAGYPQQFGELEAEALQAKLQSDLNATVSAAEGKSTEAGQPLTSEEISLLFQQMNLNDPVRDPARGNAGTGAGGSGNPTMAAGAQTLPSAAEIAKLAQDRLNGQRMAAESATANSQNGAQGSGNNGNPTTAAGAQTLPSAAEIAQLAQDRLNGQRVATEGSAGNSQNSTQANTAQTSAGNANALQPGELRANERAAQQVSGDQRQLNPANMNPQQAAQLQTTQASEGLPRNNLTHLNRASGSEWTRREINVKPEMPPVKSGMDSMPETQFRAQVQAQAQQAMFASNQQAPLSGSDSTFNSASIQGSVQSADNQFNGLTQQLNSQPAQSTQQSGTTAGSQAMQYAQLSAQVGSQAWNQQLGQQLIQMAIHNQQQISLRLNPAELGQVLVNLQMDEHGAQLQLVSQNAQARAALEQAMPQLRESLAEQGIELGQSSVSDQEQQFANQDEQDSALQAGANQADQAGEDAADGNPGTAGKANTGHDGQIDLYA